MKENKSSIVKFSLFEFFETKIKKSDLYKVKVKVDKKQQEVNKSSDKDKAKKEAELESLQVALSKQRQDSLLSEIPDYLTECSEKAISVGKPAYKVTHPVKFTHGSIEYGGICVQPDSSSNRRYLTTESLKNTYYDIANSNGNLIAHTRFLALNLDGETVYDKLKNNDVSWLSELSNDEEQIEKWAEGLKLWAAEADEIQDVSRLKQNYFPLPDDTYHITSPLFSSSLCQAVYERVRFSTFSQENKQLRKAKNNNKYAEGILVEFSNYAVMNFGGTQPQNISVGNFERHGEVFLLPCSPPTWTSSLKPPIAKASLYEGEFDRRAWRVAKEVQQYLIKLQDKKSNMEIRNHVAQSVYQIIDILLGYVAEIHSLENQAGWSEADCKLKKSHQLWLDLHREDESFQQSRQSEEWQTEVCKDFGLWLNKKLEHKDMVFAKIESSHWAKLLKRQLREFERDIKQVKELTL